MGPRSTCLDQPEKAVNKINEPQNHGGGARSVALAALKHQNYTDADPKPEKASAEVLVKLAQKSICPSSNKWNRRSDYLMESFAHHFHIMRRVVDSANDVSQ